MNRPQRLLSALACSLLLTACAGRDIVTTFDDKLLESRVADAIQKSDVDLNDTTSHIVVTVFNGAALLSGQTPSQELRQQAAAAASVEQGIRIVYNHLEVASPSSTAARSNDATITARVVGLLYTDNTIPASRIKVVTEYGTVFLLGSVTRAEGLRAADLARSVTGVQKVTLLFEYIE